MIIEFDTLDGRRWYTKLDTKLFTSYGWRAVDFSHALRYDKEVMASSSLDNIDSPSSKWNVQVDKIVSWREVTD